MLNFPPRPSIPPVSWQRSFAADWSQPYRVRYASNIDDGPYHGMPLGGLGAGCIGRSHRGEFNLWHLDGGEHSFGHLPACQFSIFEHTSQHTLAYATCTVPPEDGSLSRWQWYPSQTNDQTNGHSTGSYQALYPRSWYSYQGVYAAQLTCEQLSPVWAHNYQESSYPIGVWEWTAHNPTPELITLSIMLTWQNIVGWFTNLAASDEIRVRDDGSPVYDYQSAWGQSTGNVNQWVVDHFRAGLLMSGPRSDPYQAREGEGQWAIATVGNPTLEVFYDARWNPQGNGGEVWDIFAANGSLADRQDETPARAGEQTAVALAVRFTLKPGQTRKIPFVIAWDLPVTEFAKGVNYYRRYTDFFGRNGQNAWSMVRTALKHYDSWQAEIIAWQQPVLDRPDLPDWLKMALFNELYLMTDGGTLWTAADEDNPVGHFGVLECLDYRWYESLDVRLYGGFAPLLLWPKLEKAILLDFARAIPTEDPHLRLIGYYVQTAFGYADRPQVTDPAAMSAPRKVANATPHDLGAPNEHPWVKTNYTCYQDCNLWKDLGSDFVLQVYRAYYFTGQEDVQFLADCWPAVVAALDYLLQFDLDGDRLPENSGAPDQTFDDWRLQGISAYCGGLWLAALKAAIAIAEVLQQAQYFADRDSVQNLPPDPAIMGQEYRAWLDQAQPRYHEALWNGSYYRIDTESGSEVVMADQLCGQFWARLMGLGDIVPIDCAQQALDTVYQACFVNFHGGQIGAANGVLPDGSAVNAQDTHPLEVWTGINFGLAALLIQMGRRQEALHLTETVVNQVYTNGLQFRTPEAITTQGTFRASHYLRALAIWGVYWLLDSIPAA